MRRALGLFALLVGLAGCGSSATQQLDLPAEAAPICTKVYEPLAGLSLTKPFSYVAIRATRGPGPIEDTTRFELGTPCSDASDRTACMERLRQLHVAGRLVLDSELVYFVAMAKDDLVAYDSQEQLPKLFGDVDTAGEAALFARLQGVQIECDVTKAWKSEHGWSLVAQGGPCSTYQVFEVLPDGLMTWVRDTHVPGPC